MEAGIGLYAVLFTLNLGGIESLLYTLLPGIGTVLQSSALWPWASALLLAPSFLIGVSLPLFSGYAHFLRPGPELLRLQLQPLQLCRRWHGICLSSSG